MLASRSPLKEYEVITSSGTWYLLARNSESAAWNALGLANQKSEKLINVRLAEEWN